jgi:hypothetical protein
MKVYLIKRLTDNKYYLKKHRWDTTIHCESYFTEQAAKWHRTYWLNNYPTANEADILAPSIVIEEYEMIKTV